MREPKETPQVETSVTQTTESEPRSWSPPTLTTWEAPEETQGNAASAAVHEIGNTNG